MNDDPVKKVNTFPTLYSSRAGCPTLNSFTLIHKSNTTLETEIDENHYIQILSLS